jgi:branched-chain amino acid transport system substrate-binding protein
MPGFRLGRVPLLLTALLGLVVLTILPLTASTAEDPYEINAIIPLSGYGAFIGKGFKDTAAAVELAVNKAGGIDGRPIKFVLHDDGTQPQQAIQATNDLLAKNVPIILGSELIAICSAMAPLAQNGPVMYCISNALRPAAGSWIYTSGISNDDFTALEIRYIREHGWNKIAVLTSTDTSGQDGERSIQLALDDPANRDLKIVTTQHFAVADLSVAAQITAIRNAGAQALITFAVGTPMATILHGVSDAALDISVFSSTGNATYAQMQQYSSILPRQFYFAAPPSLVPNDLPKGPLRAAVTRYEETFKAIGVRPDISQSNAYDTIMIVVEGLRKIGLQRVTAARLRDYINNLQYIGVAGRFDFRALPQRGINSASALIAHWDSVKNDFAAMSKVGGSL